MKKQILSVLLAICMVAVLLPTTAEADTGNPSQNGSETFTDFALRMQSEYDVKVSCASSVTITPEEQGWIEKGLSVWGKEFIKLVSAGFSTRDVRRQLSIRITDKGTVKDIGDINGGNINGLEFSGAKASGAATENNIYLYPGWTYKTVVHEIVHATNFSIEKNALNDYYDRDVYAKWYMAMYDAQVNSGGTPYGPQCERALSYDYQRYEVALMQSYEDIASILQNGLDTAWIAKAKRGEMTGVKEKIEVFRDFYTEYLTGGTTPCLLVDSILGTNGVSIKSQPAVTTTVSEGRIEGSLSVDVINSSGKKVTYRWATSEFNRFPPHGSLTQARTASMEIPKTLKVGTYYYFCVIYVDGKEAMNSNIATIIVQPDTSAPGYIDPSTLGLGLNIVSLPTKKTYVVGEGFDKTGIRAVYKFSNNTVEDQTDKIKFYTSKTVELTQGRLFQTAGTKVVEIRHTTYGKMRENYSITVSEKAVETSLAPTPVPTPAPTPVPTQVPSASATAKPTNTKFMIGSNEVSLPAYLISGNNYVKLRDVAALLKTRFEVKWEDGKAKLYNKKSYTVTGGELADIGSADKTAQPSTTNFVWGDTGAAVTGLPAYTIGGNNYIKLRDIAKQFDFDVDWRDGKAWIEPDVSPYTDD